MSDLESLPAAVVQAVLEKLDVVSLCSAAASCRFLLAFVRDVLPRIPSVHLPRDTCLTEQELVPLLGNNTSIQSLKLDCSRLVEDVGMPCLIKPSLKELALYNCDNLSSNLLVQIGQHCRSLRSLSLELGWQEDRPGLATYRGGGYTRGLEVMLKGCNGLESLSLMFEGACFDSDAFAAIPLFTAGTLKALDVGFVAERDAKKLLEVRNAIDHQGPALKPGGYPHLQTLCLALDRITDSLLTAIFVSLPSLTDLDLHDEPTEEPLVGFDLTNVGIFRVASRPALRRLSLVRMPDWYPAHFKRVNDLGIFLLAESCVNLESIRLGGFSRITDASCWALLHKCAKLQTFEVLHMSQVTDLTFHDLSATSLKLECVCLSSCVLLTDHPIKQIALCKGLRTLNLNGCRDVGDEGLEAISSLLQLKTLTMNGTAVTDHGFFWLGNCISPLAVLSLRGCQHITEKGIRALFHGSIASCLEALDLSGIHSLSDGATREISQSGAELTELWLRDCPLLTDLSVIQLAESNCGATLRVLDLWNCRGIVLTSSKWLQKPQFPRLRWLGVPRTLDLDIAIQVKERRPSLGIRRNGAECNNWWAAEYVETPTKSEEEVDELEQWVEEPELS